MNLIDLRKVAAFLQTNQTYPCSRKTLRENAQLQLKSEQHSFFFVGALFEIFATKHASTLLINLDPTLQKRFIRTYHVYKEIQANLEKGQQDYSLTSFPQTKLLIDEARSERSNDDRLFCSLQQSSYGTLPFLQRAFTYKTYDSALINTLEKTREQGHRQLRLLLRPHYEEKKETHEVEKDLPLNQFFYGAGAFIIDQKEVLISELFHRWKNLSSSNRRAGEQIEAELVGEAWTVPNPPVIQGLETIDSQLPFPEYLVHCTILALEKNLGFSFRPVLKDKLKKLLSNDSIRSDSAYFAAFPDRLQQLDLASWDRPSKDLLFTFQLFFQTVRQYQVPLELQEPLLVMIFSRDKTEPIRLKPSDRTPFLLGWNSLRNLFQSILAQQLRESQSTDAFLTDKSCWPLFLFLLQKPERSHYVLLFSELSCHLEIYLSPSLIYLFCEANPHLTSDERIELALTYRNLLTFFRQKKITLCHAESIFLDPPINVRVSPIRILLGSTEIRAKKFFRLMQPYQIADKDFTQLLRRFIYAPYPNFFELLRSTEQLDVRNISAHLYPLLSHFQDFPEISPQNCVEGTQTFQRINDRYSFTEEEKLFLFFEFVRLAATGNLKQIDEIDLFLTNLTGICLGFPQKSLFYLYFHHPVIRWEQVQRFRLLHNTFIYTRTHHFIFPNNRIEEVLFTIQHLFDCNKTALDSKEYSQFLVSFTQWALASFLPPVQPISDQFRIDAFGPNGQVNWASPHLVTHAGQYKPVCSNSSLGIYFQWDLIRGLPHLYFTFYDIQNQISSSTRVRLNIPNQEIQATGGVFFEYLYQLTRCVFKDEVDGTPPEDESIDSISRAYMGLPEINEQYRKLLSEDHFREIWNFIRTVKMAYRHCFFNHFIKTLLPLPARQQITFAAEGQIYPSHPRGSLVPKSPTEYYIPNHTIDSSLFAESTQLSPLPNCHLIVSKDNQQREELPLMYFVESPEELLGTAIPQKWDERAPPRDQVKGSYVSLLVPYEQNSLSITLHYPEAILASKEQFDRYFDFHQLLLKARYYFSCSSEKPPGLGPKDS